MSVRIYISLFLILVGCARSLAQQNDFVLLQGVKLEKRLNQRVAGTLSVQNMFNQNVSEWWIGFVDAGITLRLAKGWDTQFHLRQIRLQTPENAVQHRQLYFHTLSWTGSKNKWAFSVRHRTQQLVFGEHFNNRFRGPFWYVRDRALVAYRINYYWRPYTAFEAFFPLNRPTRPTIDQVRWTLGFFRTFNDHFKLETFYQLQQPVQRPNATVRYVWGVNLFFIL